MDTKTNNIIKNVAKKVNEQIKKLRAENPKADLDDVCREALDMYYPQIQPLGIKRHYLAWHVGVLNGVFQDR